MNFDLISNIFIVFVLLFSIGLIVKHALSKKIKEEAEHDN